MITHLSKKFILISSLISILILASILHNSVINSGLDNKLKKLHASGVFVDIIKEHEGFFTTEKTFTVRLDKVELVADLLLGIRNNDPLLVHLSKLQGLKLTVSVEHTKFIFSNDIHLHISLANLPEYFADQSKLLSDILAYSKKQSELIRTTYNVWNNSFNITLPSLHHQFTAEHNLSYALNIDNLQLEGVIENHSDFTLSTSLSSFELTLIEDKTPKVKLTLNQPSFSYTTHPDQTQTELAIDRFDLFLDNDENATIKLSEFESSQSYIQEEMTNFKSSLSLDTLTLRTAQQNLELQDFRYDINLDHLNPQTLAHLSELIHTTNTNEVIFIFDDLSDDMLSLIQDDAYIKINDISFSNMILDKTPYYDAELALLAQSQSENLELPIKFELKLHLSRALYKYFLDHVPNASFTQNYLPKDSAAADFDLSLIEDGFLINGHILSFTQDNNQSQDLNFL